MRRTVLLGALVALSFSASATAGPIDGSWTQKSDGQELTLVPRLKIAPSISATGMVIGTAGYGGSATTTTLQSEFIPMRTQRAMSLVIRPDGAFTWTIDRSRAASTQSSGCKLMVREEKTGRVRRDGDRLVFDVTGGTQSARDSCDPAKTSRGVKAPISESYSYRVAGGALTLSGPGGLNWTFSRG
jgi:hypothetical protein